MEIRYEYAPDGQVSRISTFTQTNSEQTQFGPEIFVVEYSYDNAGRIVRKVVRNNSSQDSTVRYGSDYTYDGMGRMVRERIWRWDQMTSKMITTQDIKTTYDLSGNPTQILFSDNAGFAYEETRTYARGYQLTGCSIGRYAADVTVSVSGSYTYDTNNNLLTTKKVDVKRGTTQLTYRDSWTFEFDRKNRLKAFKQSWNDNQTHIWYDGLGRVWQRWEFDTVEEEWASTGYSPQSSSPHSPNVNL